MYSTCCDLPYKPLNELRLIDKKHARSNQDSTRNARSSTDGCVVSTGRWLDQSVIARTRRRLDSLTERASSELKPARQIYTTFYCVAGGRRPTTNSVNIKQISAANSLTRECLDNYPAIICRRCTWQRRRASLSGCERLSDERQTCVCGAIPEVLLPDFEIHSAHHKITRIYSPPAMRDKTSVRLKVVSQ